MEKSEHINELASALSLFQSKQKTIEMNAENPFLKNKYADLNALIDGTRKNLNDHGLSVSQILNSDGVYTILIHNSGQWIGGVFKIEPTDAKGLNLAQTMGVSITYARRYAYASILGLVTDKDTDGADNTNPNGKKPKSDTKITNWLTEENYKKIFDMPKDKAVQVIGKYTTPPNGMKKEYYVELVKYFEL